MAHMKLKKRLHRVASAVTFALTVLTLSAGTAHEVQAAQDNNTKVNVGVTELTEGNVSFEVPLYYVLCVTKDENGTATTIAPKESYGIVNKSTKQQDVAVTQITVSGVTGGTWSLVGENELGTSTTDKKIAMTLGGVALPNVVAGATTETKIATKDVTTENVFYKGGKYTRLTPYDAQNPTGSTLTIPIEAKVADQFVAQNVKTVAQFKLSYTISPLNKNGDVLTAN